MNLDYSRAGIAADDDYSLIQCRPEEQSGVNPSGLTSDLCFIFPDFRGH